MIISEPKTSFLGVVFDVDHDFEGPRAPKAHLDTVNTNLLDHLPPPFSEDTVKTVFLAWAAAPNRPVHEVDGVAPAVRFPLCKCCFLCQSRFRNW